MHAAPHVNRKKKLKRELFDLASYQTRRRRQQGRPPGGSVSASSPDSLSLAAAGSVGRRDSGGRPGLALLQEQLQRPLHGQPGGRRGVDLDHRRGNAAAALPRRTDDAGGSQQPRRRCRRRRSHEAAVARAPRRHGASAAAASVAVSPHQLPPPVVRRLQGLLARHGYDRPCLMHQHSRKLNPYTPTSNLKQ